jgi:hypothetical protein
MKYTVKYVKIYKMKLKYIGPNIMIGQHFCSPYVYNPAEDIPTLALWWGLRGQMILRAMPAVALLLAGSPLPDRSKVMTQTKRDTLFLQVEGWA